MHKDENGHIVVETIGAFIPFVLLVISILSLVNIVTLQARIHYALTQAANTLSMYSYVLEATGATKALENMNDQAAVVETESTALKSDILAVLDGLDSISGIGTSTANITNRVYGWGESVAADPKSAMQKLMNYGLKEGADALLEALVRPLVGRYLANGSLSGDEYLKRANVDQGLKGLEFYTFNLLDLNSSGSSNSTLLDGNHDLKLVVRYKISYKFGALPLPFSDDFLTVTQTVKTKPWLNGSREDH